MKPHRDVPCCLRECEIASARVHYERQGSDSYYTTPILGFSARGLLCTNLSESALGLAHVRSLPCYNSRRTRNTHCQHTHRYGQCRRCAENNPKAFGAFRGQVLNYYISGKGCTCYLILLIRLFQCFSIDCIDD